MGMVLGEAHSFFQQHLVCMQTELARQILPAALLVGHDEQDVRSARGAHLGAHGTVQLWRPVGAAGAFAGLACPGTQTHGGQGPQQLTSVWSGGLHVVSLRWRQCGFFVI